MGDVIKVDFRMRWAKPVFVGDDDRLTRTVIGPVEAISFMKSSFHSYDGESYARAWQGCHDAIEGRVSAMTARKLFVAAYADDCVRSSWESQELRLMEGEL